MEIIDSKAEMSQSIGKLAEALAKAQGEMPSAPKDAKNPHFKNNYASFESIVANWKSVGPKYGLSISQLPIAAENGAVGVRTVLMHQSGEFLASTLLLKPVKGDPQAAGSAITYAKRYAFAAITGMPTGEGDDDAESASGRGERRHDPPPREDRSNGHASNGGSDSRPRRDAEAGREEAMKLIADARTAADLEQLKAKIVDLVPKDHPARTEVVDYLGKRHKALTERPSFGATR